MPLRLGISGMLEGEVLFRNHGNLDTFFLVVLEQEIPKVKHAKSGHSFEMLLIHFVKSHLTNF